VPQHGVETLPDLVVVLPFDCLKQQPQIGVELPFSQLFLQFRNSLLLAELRIPALRDIQQPRRASIEIIDLALDDREIMLVPFEYLGPPSILLIDILQTRFHSLQSLFDVFIDDVDVPGMALWQGAGFDAHGGGQRMALDSLTDGLAQPGVLIDLDSDPVPHAWGIYQSLYMVVFLAHLVLEIFHVVV
jgi:hypothetical protein